MSSSTNFRTAQQQDLETLFCCLNHCHKAQVPLIMSFFPQFLMTLSCLSWEISLSSDSGFTSFRIRPGKILIPISNLISTAPEKQPITYLRHDYNYRHETVGTSKSKIQQRLRKIKETLSRKDMT